MKTFDFARVSVALVVIWAHAIACSAESLAKATVDKKIETAKARFQEKVNAARKGTLAEYDRTIAVIKGARGVTEAARQDKLDRWMQAKRLFESTSTFPAEDEFAAMELSYFLVLNKGFIPMAKVINETIEKENKSDVAEQGSLGRQMKNHFEQQMLGSNKFDSHSRWFGTLERPGGTIPYHLGIGVKGQGGSFVGHVEDNPGVQGNWSYDFEGQMSGLAIEYVMTKCTRGGFQEVHVVGIVSGDRLIARVTQKIGGGTSSGLMILHRR